MNGILTQPTAIDVQIPAVQHHWHLAFHKVVHLQVLSSELGHATSASVLLKLYLHALDLQAKHLLVPMYPTQRKDRDIHAQLHANVSHVVNDSAAVCCQVSI